MTDESGEEFPAGEDSIEHVQRTPFGQPLWTYFLTPAAVALGALLIAGAIWYTDDDVVDSAPTLPSAQEQTAPAGGQSQAPQADGTASGVRSLLTVFNGYAKQVGIDQGKFQQCLGKPETGQLISKHLQRGVTAGVNGTPTFFVNNKKIVGAQPAAVFDEVIAAELNGSPATLDGYSATIKQLAATDRFAIVEAGVDTSDAAIEGSPRAKVTIAEFSDFQCPFCRRWTQENVARLRAQFGPDLALAFLHFPIGSIHPNAGNASAAAVCAGEQGRFWQMHDLLFAQQAEWANLQPN
ncbi:MAG: DsbA family protein [Chloroflexota bacterium]